MSPTNGNINSSLTIRNLRAGDVHAVANLLKDSFNRFNETVGQPPEVDNADTWLELAKHHVPQQEGEFTGLVATLPYSVDTEKQGYKDKNSSCVVVACTLLDHADNIALGGPFATSIHLQSSGVMKQLLKAFNQKVDDHKIPHSILLQNQSNLVSFTLYAKLNYRPVGVFMFCEGWLEDDSTATDAKQYTVRPMTVEDVDHCVELHQRCNGWNRRQGLLQQQKSSSCALLAVDSNQKVVGYWTEPTIGGHLVATNDNVVKALFVGMCQAVKRNTPDKPAAPSLAVSHRSYELMCWFLQHKSIRATRQMCLMQRQAKDSIKPLSFAQNGLVFCSSIVG